MSIAKKQKVLLPAVTGNFDEFYEFIFIAFEFLFLLFDSNNCFSCDFVALFDSFNSTKKS